MPSVTKTATVDRQRRADLEQRVLHAVKALLADGTTYTEVPVHRIAAEAGIARSTFYLYFPDKGQLLIRLAELATADILNAGETWWLSDHHDGQAGLVTAMTQMIASFREHRLLLRSIGEVSAYDREVAHYWLGRIGPFIQFAQDRLEQLKTAGAINPDLDTAATAHILTWTVERSISHHFTTDDGAGDHRLANALSRAIWLTIYGDAPQNG